MDALLSSRNALLMFEVVQGIAELKNSTCPVKYPGGFVDAFKKPEMFCLCLIS